MALKRGVSPKVLIVYSFFNCSWADVLHQNHQMPLTLMLPINSSPESPDDRLKQLTSTIPQSNGIRAIRLCRATRCNCAAQ